MMKQLLLLLFVGAALLSYGQCNLNISWTSNVVGGNITFTNTSTGVPSNPQFAWLYDGQSSSLENPTFPYDSAVSTVCFAIYSSDTTCEDSICGPIGSPPCTLNLSWYSVINGGNITFTNTTTGMPSNPSFAWLYNGQSSSLENPTFPYDSATTNVCFAIYDIDNPSCQDSICGPLNDSTVSTGCNLATSFIYVHNGSTIDFINTSTGEPVGAMYDWWYNGQSSGMENPTLNAASTDEYACLTVYDSTWSCYDSVCVLIYADTTGGTGCNLSTGFTYVHNGTTVDFTDISTGVPAGATYDWWYNGQSSNQQNPTFNASSVDDYACLTIYDSSWTCYDSICFMVYVDSTGGGGGDSTVSVVEVVETSFDVYPNPASSEINLSVNNGNGFYTVSVIDLTGRIVLETELTGNQATIDITTLESGGYLLYLIDQESPDNVEVVKILKE